MFDPERLLGNLLIGGVSRGLSRSGGMGLARGLMGNKAAIGMGLLGAAIAAFEHFSEGSTSGRHIPQPAYSPPPMKTPPIHESAPPPNAPAAQVTTLPPPPPPAKKEESVPTPLPTEEKVAVPEPPDDVDAQKYNDGILLIRAMIAAAHADGQLDDEERSRIIDQLNKEDIGDSEREFMQQELDHPMKVDELVQLVHTQEMAGQVYAVSLLAIELNTYDERSYLSTLARKLKLTQTEVNRWHEQLGAPAL